MPLIHVRNRHSGETTTVSEAAFGFFAADFERIEPPAPPVKVKPPKSNPISGTAAPKVKE